jgi:hypothetical protein
VLPLLWAERTRLLVLPPMQLGLGGGQGAETTLPFGFETARDESIFGLDHPIAALGAFGVIARPFDLESPLREGRIVVRVQLFHCEQRRGEGGWCHRVQKSIRYRVVDRDAADIETIDPTPVDDVLAGTMVPGVEFLPR